MGMTVTHWRNFPVRFCRFVLVISKYLDSTCFTVTRSFTNRTSGSESPKIQWPYIPLP